MTEAKVALITAGGSGLGAHVARRLHEEDGYRIGILSSSGNGEELAKTLGGVGVTGSNLMSTIWPALSMRRSRNGAESMQ